MDEPEPDEDAKAVGVRRQKRVAAGKKKDLLGARLPDSGKRLERFLCDRERLVDHIVEVAVELLVRDPRALPELLRELRAEDALRRDALEVVERGLQDLVRARSDGVLEHLEGLAPASV